MKQNVNIAAIFPKYLFWDMDYSKLNPTRDKDIIIPRAMYATTEDTFEDDIKKLDIELKAWGEPLTELLQNNEKVLSI